MEDSGEAPEGEEDVQRAMEGYARVIRRQNATNYTQSTSSRPRSPLRLAQFNWAPPPQNAFALFWREKRPEIMKKYEYGSNSVDVNREVAKVWKWLSKAKYGHWLDRFKEMREEYLRTHPNYRFRSPTARNPSNNMLMIPRQQTNQNRRITAFERFYAAILDLTDFNQQQFPPDFIDEDINARWYGLTLQQRASYDQNYTEAQQPNRQNPEPRMPVFAGNQRLIAVSPTRPNAFLLEANLPNQGADPQIAQDQRYQPERPRPLRDEPRRLRPGRPQPHIDQNAEALPERFDAEDPIDYAENYFQEEEPLLDIHLYTGPAPIDPRHDSELPRTSRDPYAGLTGIATRHSGLFPGHRPQPGVFRLQNNPEDFVEYMLPNGNLPNALRRSPEGSRNESGGQQQPTSEPREPTNVGIYDEQRWLGHGSSSQELSRSQSSGPRGHHRQQNSQPIRDHQQWNGAHDLSPPRIFSRPPVEASSPARGSSGASPSNPPSYEPARLLEPVPERSLVDTVATSQSQNAGSGPNTQQWPVARTVFRDFGPDPPEDPWELEVWESEQRLMEQRYGTPSKFSPSPDQRVLDRTGTPQFSTPRSGPAASPTRWEPGSGPLSVSFHRSPMINFDDEDSEEEMREVCAPSFNGHAKNNVTMAQYRPPSSASRAGERPFVYVTPSVEAQTLTLFRVPAPSASRDSEDVEGQHNRSSIGNEGLNIPPDDSQNLEFDDRMYGIREVHPNEMTMYLGPMQSADESDLDAIHFQSLLAQDVQENHQIEEHYDPQEPQEAREPQLHSYIMEEMAEMYLNPSDDSFSYFPDCDALCSTLGPLDPDHPICQILKQG